MKETILLVVSIVYLPPLKLKNSSPTDRQTTVRAQTTPRLRRKCGNYGIY